MTSEKSSIEAQQPGLSRRQLAAGAAWATPVIAASAVVPAYAASTGDTAGSEYGLFVTTAYNGGFVGYTHSDDAGFNGPTSPQAYWANGGTYTPTMNVTSEGCFTDGMAKVGAGSYTPVTNSGSGSNGGYVSSTGFWFSVPTTAVKTGTGYVPGSRAVLKAGARFSTLVTVVVPTTSNWKWTLNNIALQGSAQKWTKTLNGRMSDLNATAPYLGTANVAGTWNASAPTIKDNGDGTATFTGTITYTTSRDYTLTQTGSKYYGQVVILPGVIEVYPGYGFKSFSLTSQVESATITYSGAEVPNVQLNNELQTTATIRSC
ncbi:amino acid oxidase [uncultured Rothia sp.]|uniref:amino acid oxidase n=1 Tax=uncultured Rothia sp. TaxID=316088 RepID=UPI0028D2E1B4|nr:amino acid oxidase [uncultured Rothia sp.]